MTIADIINELERFAPPALQESYDNSGLQAGDRNTECSGALLSLDCTEEVIDEAIREKCNLVISHHPLIFSPLKRLTGSNPVERTLIKAIRNNVALYACHTNLDNVQNGVNKKIAEKLGLTNLSILSPKKGHLRKLAVFVPATHLEKVRDAVFKAGAGNIGNYDSCSFDLEGSGTFRGGEGTKPFLGKSGELSREKETRLETIFPSYLENRVIDALIKAHPYEEVAYDIYALQNSHQQTGSGMTGVLEKELSEEEFLALVKTAFGARALRHTPLRGRPVSKVAVCGGSGRFLLQDAIRSGAQAFVTADFKYHDFFDADGKIVVVDTGHFESEQFTPDIFYEIINGKFPTFAIRLSKTRTNPVNYYF
jgi:dinuclear metal center YbgI/SA1388 family protein